MEALSSLLAVINIHLLESCMLTLWGIVWHINIAFFLSTSSLASSKPSWIFSSTHSSDDYVTDLNMLLINLQKIVVVCYPCLKPTAQPRKMHHCASLIQLLLYHDHILNIMFKNGTMLNICLLMHEDSWLYVKLFVLHYIAGIHTTDTGAKERNSTKSSIKGWCTEAFSS